MNKPERIIIHHSLTDDNEVLRDFDSFKKYHMQVRGFKDIGYHYVIEHIDGKAAVTKGRSESEEGAHCKESGMNRRSIGICFAGNYDIEQLPEDMFELGVKLIKDIRKRYNNPKMPIETHSKYAPYKSCPGKLFPMAELIRRCNEVAPIQTSRAERKVPPLIRRGDSGVWVEFLQKKLGFKGRYLDGIFGPKTEDAVNYFQKSHGLVVDGIVGAKTWSKLGY